ncbi:unnamed protein product [Bemisia tabaci]|uniref:Uncharacterized protein n=1 Tax=Bemisia tabaci TaxID=7038 RepID=A0A9P0F0E2_BEMTA|nr:unnamed protein product [Bemisia tabaci]
MQNVNGQKSGVIPRNNVTMRDSSHIPVSQHDDLIQFMFDSWNKVFCEQQANGQGNSCLLSYLERDCYHSPMFLSLNRQCLLCCRRQKLMLSDLMNDLIYEGFSEETFRSSLAL